MEPGELLPGTRVAVMTVIPVAVTIVVMIAAMTVVTATVTVALHPEGMIVNATGTGTMIVVVLSHLAVMIARRGTGVLHLLGTRRGMGMGMGLEPVRRGRTGRRMIGRGGMMMLGDGEVGLTL